MDNWNCTIGLGEAPWKSMYKKPIIWIWVNSGMDNSEYPLLRRWHGARYIATEMRMLFTHEAAMHPKWGHQFKSKKTNPKPHGCWIRTGLVRGLCRCGCECSGLWCTGRWIHQSVLGQKRRTCHCQWLREGEGQSKSAAVYLGVIHHQIECHSSPPVLDKPKRRPSATFAP